jgi:hypothetical protein
MIRSILAVAAGYFSIALLSGFSRLIISIYLRNDITLTGIENFPTTWGFGLTGLGFFFGLFGGLLTTTLAESKGFIEIVGFILVMAAVALLDYSMLNDREPFWYLIASPTLKISGIFIGYHLKRKQDKQLEQV